MSQGINTVILIGNLGSDPEMYHMPNDETVDTWKKGPRSM